MITRKHLEKVKGNCKICNMGHSNQEIDMESLKDLKKEKIRRNLTHIPMPNGKTVVMLAEVSSVHVVPPHGSTNSLKQATNQVLYHVDSVCHRDSLLCVRVGKRY